MPEAKPLRHFFDLDRGTRRRPVCDSPNFDSNHLEIFDTFGKTGGKRLPRCKICVTFYKEWQKRIRTCQICHKEFESNEAMGDHHREHVLELASRVGEPLAFTLSVQSCYNESSTKARMLALAQRELRDYFPGKQFTVMPSRSMLVREHDNNVIIGEAHVASYIFAEI